MTDRIERVVAIECRCEPYDWPFARDAADDIDALWARAVAEKPGLYDGRVLVARQVSFERTGEHGLLRAISFETSYKAFFAWRNLGFPGERVVNLFSMCALRSADGAYMLGKMGPGTASAGSLYFPAGTPEPCDIRDGLLDLHGNMIRELEEETGLTPADMELEADWTLVFDGARIACLKNARSPLSATALVAAFENFRATQAEPELDALVPVQSLSDLDQGRMPGFMLAYLRYAFGSERSERPA